MAGRPVDGGPGGAGVAAEVAAEVAALVGRLGLEPHPEGGWYRRTWASDHPCDPDRTAGGGAPVRAAGSSILFLLDAATTSRWHRVDADELWSVVDGDPVELSTWAGGDVVSRSVVGPGVLDGRSPQQVVPAGAWQSARSLGAWSLAVCVVVPEFRFDGFELAPDGWSPPAG